MDMKSSWRRPLVLAALCCCALLAAVSILFWRAAANGSSPKVLHVFVQIADPQLGMLTQYYPNPKEWTDETDMLSRLVTQAMDMQPKPTFFFVGGDMQNFWPNENGTGRNANDNVPNLTIDGKDLGFHQREDVKKELSRASRRGFPVHYTAGNHDVGDQPNANEVDTMKLYTDNWGPHQHVVLNDSDILYLQINSQLYFDSDASLDVYRQEQNRWLDVQLNLVTASTKLVVVMTHIPPFLNDVHEQEGWATWKARHRKEVLDKFSSKLGKTIPLLWVAGHFHGNMKSFAVYKELNMYIRVTSSAGTPMLWDGRKNFTSAQAAAVGTKEDAGTAFNENIVSGDPANIGKRLQAVASRAGLRVFKVYSDGSFQDQWFTVAELEDKGTLSMS